MARTTTLCLCDRRTSAEALGIFVRDVRGWTFPADPLRQMSKAARYFALVDRSQFPHTDMTGHPYRWRECPYCGNTLPGVEGDHSSPDATGGCDGEWE